LKAPLQSINAEIHFLPTYSPENNPCELVFSKVKNFIRSSPQRYDEQSFEDLITESFAQVTKGNVRSFYKHCILNSKPIKDQVIVNI